MGKDIKFGERFRAARHRSGLTMKDVADRIGASDRSVRRWELDQCTPSAADLVRYASAVGVQPIDLLPGGR